MTLMTKLRIIRLLLTVVFVIGVILFSSGFFIGCSDEKEELSITNVNADEKGKGEVETRILSVGTFYGVDLASFPNVRITQGNTQLVKAIGSGDVIAQIKATVISNVLKIEMENSSYTNSQLSIDITIPSINFLSVSGSGDMHINDFDNQDSLSVKMVGSGELHLNKFEGIEQMYVTITGSGIFQAKEDIETLNNLALVNSGSGSYCGFDIVCDNADVKSAGSGKSEVNVRAKLKATIQGAGNVYYKGNPVITKVDRGTGSLINAN
ncbi:DUF2807 domain-containing protein [Prolixibacteraceae bacterium JC049]|nr:DUF2807 domain-containing protein [Prolixibacteraceae bacterium JC049]